MRQSTVTLVDTSSWIEALRSRGRAEVRERVRKLLIEGEAAWCDLVAVELWCGAVGEHEKSKLFDLEKEILCLPTTDDVWNLARELARRCRAAGTTVPSTDLIVAACALFHGAKLEHCDSHFETILRIYK
jgi:hypothetical protein